jgi:hypothetical protein
MGRETMFNVSQPKNAKPITQKDYGDPGQVLELGCDIHRWMKAYVVITDHPFFTVSDENGAFSLKHVPTDRAYTIEAWHPTLGMKSQLAKAGAKIEFVFP